jgi:hypothetical protein
MAVTTGIELLQRLGLACLATLNASDHRHQVACWCPWSGDGSLVWPGW